MNIFKATFFANGSGHKIDEIVCVKLTFDAVVISRSIDEMKHIHSNKPIIEQRETKNKRYCATELEAIDFLDSKYGNIIEEKKNNLYDIEARRKSLKNMGVS